MPVQQQKRAVGTFSTRQQGEYLVIVDGAEDGDLAITEASGGYFPPFLRLQ